MVGFVRNVMVGRNGLTRDALLDIFTGAGGQEPASHLVTGNVTFQLVDDVESFQRRAEQSLHEVIGHHEPIFIRSLSYLAKQIEMNPFRELPFDDVYERCVSFAKHPLGALPLPIATAREDAVAFARYEDDIYSVTRLLKGRTGTVGKVLERTLGSPVTTRNWNTIEFIVRKSPGRCSETS